MPFNFLLTNNLLCNTSWVENGTKISMSPENGEKILFFKLDDGNNSISLKKALNMRNDNQSVCDLLVYYQKIDVNNTKKIMCFAEGKGTDIKHAVEQIQNTYRVFCGSLPKSILGQVIWTAYIQGNPGSSLKNTKELKNELICSGIKKCEIGKTKFEQFIRTV
ncbi:hypothetical protein [Methanosarcina mazei]|uniref:Uncharacterized protein n=1 Tax=Methanosarcina mazei TaxID=2209 RepID=A0A0F8HSY8_METMZ|nr:hypothetical protein [Methanosarcina mazei]KKG79796.1 hypothetical protein DU55_13035 [Methanosarcina mazei]